MSTTPEVVDATAVDVTETAAPAEIGAELVVRERRSEVIRPLNVDQVVESMEEYQRLLPRLLAESDWQDAGRGKKFVKKSGWRKIATAFDLDVRIIKSEVVRDGEGRAMRAEVIARAITPAGRSMDGDGYCSFEEDRFSGDRGNTSKLENDLRATAATRAKNRAIADLVGMGDVSAEEVSAQPERQGSGELPAWAKNATAKEGGQAQEDLASLVGEERATKMIAGLFGAAGDSFPVVAVWAIRAVVRAVKAPVPEQAPGSAPAAADAPPPDDTCPQEADVVDEPAVPGVDPAVLQALKESSVAELEKFAADDPLDEVRDAAAAELRERKAAAQPAAGTVVAPKLSSRPGEALTQLRAVGCTCPDPLATLSEKASLNDDCPISGHGIGF